MATNSSKALLIAMRLSRLIAPLVLTLVLCFGAWAQESTGKAEPTTASSPIIPSLLLTGACVVEIALFYGIATILSRLLIERRYPPIAARIGTFISGLLLLVTLTITVLAMWPKGDSTSSTTATTLSPSPSPTPSSSDDD